MTAEIVVLTLLLGVLSSYVANVLWHVGWRTGRKSPASIELATRVLKFLEGDAESNTKQIVYLSKQLGDALVAAHNRNLAIEPDIDQEPLHLIDETLAHLKPLVTELTASNDQLDDLKRAVIEYKEGLEWRARIVRHLVSPPNPSAIDGGHIRSQLLEESTKPSDLLNNAIGEAALFLRGPGTSLRYRWRKYRQFRKKHRANYKEAVTSEYRKMLRQTAVHHARS